MNSSKTTPVEAIPAATRSSRYGWIIIVCSALTMLATLPGRTQGLGLITEPMLKDLQIDHLDYAQINLWATLIGASFCLPIGWLIDRLGVRLTTTLILLATGLVTWWMSALAGGYWLLFLAVTLTRGFGQSALSVCSITSIGKWYSRRAGPAMGAYAVLTGVFFVIAFLLVPADIRMRGWRAAWGTVAMVLMFGIAPLAALLLRDGRRDEVQADEPEKEGLTELTLSEALKTKTFWAFGLATSFFGLAFAGLGLFGESILAQHGFAQKDYHAFMGFSMLTGLIAQMLVGWLTTRQSLGPIAGITMLVYAAGLALVNFVNSQVMLVLCGALLGAAGGGITVIFFAVWSRAFGRKHLGRIQGAAQLLSVLASAGGPLLFAACASRFGSYGPAMWMLVPVIVLLGMVCWGIRLEPPKV